MTITEAFEDVLFNSKPQECCMTPGQMKMLRQRYKSGCQIGHKTMLTLLACRGYVITVEKESSNVYIDKILSSNSSTPVDSGNP